MALKINRLFIGYLIIAFSMTTFAIYNVYWSIFLLMWLSEPNMLYIIVQVPWMLLFEALPLSAFVFLLFKKGGASSHFEQWNMGRKLRIPSILLLLGYIVAVIPAPLNILTNGNFLYTSSNTFNPIYFYTIYSGFTMMLSGLVALISLWVHRKMSLRRLN